MESYVDNTVAPPARTTAGPDAGFFGRLKTGSTAHAIATCLYKYDIHLKHKVYVLLTGVFSVLSVLILWSEVFMGMPTNLSPFGVVLESLHGDDGKTMARSIEVISLIPLAYMSVCVYSSLFKLRIFGRYGLRKGLSDGGALIFNAEYLVRIQFPLCYNYLLFLRYKGSEGCAFMKVMSHMETVPFFGTLTFNSYAPLLICLLGLATKFNA